jgi:hypothetical protein
LKSVVFVLIMMESVSPYITSRFIPWTRSLVFNKIYKTTGESQ